MNENLILALQITLVGMGLVFAAILLLWGVMALLVRLTARSVDVEAEQERAALTELERKQRAAAAAVAIALAQTAEATEPHEFPLPPTAIVSAWQAVMRTRILNKRGPTR
ncbi:MAG: OadG family protein [Anaerolineales bacterium]|jgi:Na+-transporting methylmalonyl-CoA/oxaloacetate decarboxylase gamma subunit|nr:OadG family protein [Anaerolineales bacterium]